MGVWAGDAERGTLRWRYAQNDDPFVEQFDCGDDEYAQEVNSYFRSAAWTRSTRPTTVLQFGFDDDERVALAATRLNLPDGILLVLGIDRGWQGRTDPGLPDLRVLDSIVQTLAAMAREQGATHLSLRVRTGNVRARAAYARAGFVHRADVPGGTTVELARPV